MEQLAETSSALERCLLALCISIQASVAMSVALGQGSGDSHLKQAQVSDGVRMTLVQPPDTQISK